MNAKSTRRKAKDGAGIRPGEVYRLSRMLHGYISAFAFAALLFFSATGLILNHPEWRLTRRPAEQTRIVHLPADQLAAAMKLAKPGPTLIGLVGKQTRLMGDYQSGTVLDGMVYLRMESPRGSSDVTITTDTGEAEVSVRPASFVGMLNDLHIGKTEDKAWRLAMDVSAVAFMLLSLLGYVLFFSMRFRLKVSLALTAASLLAMLAIVLLMT